MKKMNNKGFSLVELIVVVLIMAIIAVALAPQVMKWVENSRKSTDCNNYDSVVSAVNLALADETVMSYVGTSGPITLSWPKTTGKPWQMKVGSGTLADITSSNSDALSNKLVTILGTSWYEEVLVKRTDFTSDTGSVLGEIEISKDGTVARKVVPASKNIS